MTSKSNDLKQALKDLHALQYEQLESVKQITGLRKKIEKRSRKTQKKELKMAQLEQQVHEVLDPAKQNLVGNMKGLRPARLIVNADSGTFRELFESPEKLVEKLKAHGIAAELYIKTSSKAVKNWAREAVKNDEELVIVAGGDGTIEDVAFQLIDSETTLGIIPTGTMNNLARALGIPLEIDQACALVGTGSTRPIDAGCIKVGKKSKCTYFLETAGLGLSIALPAGQNIRKRRFHKLPDQFRKMFNQELAPAEIELDTGEKIQTKVQLVTVSNAPLFAMNNMIAPDAKMDDGLFDIAIYDGMTDLELANYFLSNAKANRVSNPNVRFYRARKVYIHSSEERPSTADKDELPVENELYIKIIPRAIRTIVGQGMGLSWPVEAVQSVPPLTGEQKPSKSEKQAEQEASTQAAAEQENPRNGTGNGSTENPLQQPESSISEENK